MFKFEHGGIRQGREFVGRPAGINLDGGALIRAQLARMTDGQLRRFIVWLDHRGAATGTAFAVHQADPKDPATRDLVELRFGGDPPRPRLRLTARDGYRRPFGQVALR